nr:hypothetical protein [Tanacetum cinerariifolium]
MKATRILARHHEVVFEAIAATQLPYYISGSTIRVCSYGGLDTLLSAHVLAILNQTVYFGPRKQSAKKIGGNDQTEVYWMSINESRAESV